jgi:hypothetical protein
MLIATLPLLPRYRYDISRHPLVDELRYNTIMPLDVDIPTAVRQLAQVAGDKPLWLDLKTRQLRITKFAYLPYDYVELSHTISVELPARIHFKDCVAVIESIVEGNKLILAERPMRTVGAGEPVNILEPTLEIQGFLTLQDREFIEAAKNEGLHRYMLSFVEKKEDIEEVLALDPQAMIVAKIESPRGLDLLKEHRSFDGPVTLMAARDDLYINMGESKVGILNALELIVARDAHAIAASRLLTSLFEDPVVSMGDISDLHMLTMMGYRSFMLSDEICRIRDVFRRVIETFKSYCDYRGDGGTGG